MHLYTFIDATPSDSIATVKDKIQKKRKVIKSKEDKEKLNEVEHVLTDYHRRRRYDDMGDFQIYLPFMSQEKFFNSYVKPITMLSSLSKMNKKRSDKTNTYVHTYQYQNINGKEQEKEESYMIDKNGKKTKLPLLKQQKQKKE